MSRRIWLLVGLILLSALPASLAWQGAFAGPASAANATVANKYLSCSYPKGTPGKYIPNARSWQEQGFTQEIRGIDISVWQHPNGKPIDFARLKSDFDISFVIIKSSDGGMRGNDNAKKWFPIDSAAAKAQGLIVGGYHYALPGNMDPNTITDAKLQAKRAVAASKWRSNRRAAFDSGYRRAALWLDHNQTCYLDKCLPGRGAENYGSHANNLCKWQFHCATRRCRRNGFGALSVVVSQVGSKAWNRPKRESNLEK